MFNSILRRRGGCAAFVLLPLELEFQTSPISTQAGWARIAKQPCDNSADRSQAQYACDDEIKRIRILMSMTYAFILKQVFKWMQACLLLIQSARCSLSSAALSARDSEPALRAIFSCIDCLGKGIVSVHTNRDFNFCLLRRACLLFRIKL